MLTWLRVSDLMRIGKHADRVARERANEAEDVEPADRMIAADDENRRLRGLLRRRLNKG